MTALTKNHDILTAEVKKHIEADAVVQGKYWDGSKGCFIGCLTHSNDPEQAFERFGIPTAVMRLAENIFEMLSPAEARDFFAALPQAVGRDGRDLSRVHWAFLAAELSALPATRDDIQAVIDPVIAGMDQLASGGDWSRADAARAAAYAAAHAAARAAAARRQRDTLLRLIAEAT